jgi:hypothetical protein
MKSRFFFVRMQSNYFRRFPEELLLYTFKCLY